jgi:hypothetical protein
MSIAMCVSVFQDGTGKSLPSSSVVGLPESSINGEGNRG